MKSPCHLIPWAYVLLALGMVFVCGVTCLGCRGNRPPASNEVIWPDVWPESKQPTKEAKATEKSSQRRDSQKASIEEKIDDLWRQGYGYQNPNTERLKNGEPTESFFKNRKRRSWKDRKRDREYHPPDPERDPLYNEWLRGLPGDPW